MAKLGLTEERKALGLPDKYEVAKTHKTEGAHISLEERWKQHEQADLLASKLLDYIEARSGRNSQCN